VVRSHHRVLSKGGVGYFAAPRVPFGQERWLPGSVPLNLQSDAFTPVQRSTMKLYGELLAKTRVAAVQRWRATYLLKDFEGKENLPVVICSMRYKGIRRTCLQASATKSYLHTRRECWVSRRSLSRSLFQWSTLEDGGGFDARATKMLHPSTTIKVPSQVNFSTKSLFSGAKRCHKSPKAHFTAIPCEMVHKETFKKEEEKKKI